jgi:hypothetical protein
LCAVAVLVMGLTGLWGAKVHAQEPGDEPTPLKLMVGRHLTMADAENGTVHARVQPPKAGVGRRLNPEAARRGKDAQRAEASGNGIAFYPADLTYQGGKVLRTVESHDIYVNCTASCFGFPGTFLNNWGHSALMRVTDQYVGTRESHRYTVGPGGIINYPVSGPLGPDDFLTLVYVAASAFGTGYGEVYHIFLAAGTDVCLDQALTVCYSPDNPNTFYFCAFHGSVDFKDIGHVIFSVEPYANVNGCQVNQPSPNSAETDSQANTLSHELTEAITDPDGDAWWNLYGLGNVGEEIGDECANIYYSYANTSLNGRLYEIQPEYSNLQHACVFRTPSD